MRVFVVGTGRCGTTTFSKACGHIKNYKTIQEPSLRSVDGQLKFPLESEPNVIHIDPRLTFMLPLLPADSFIVHMRRKRDEVIHSWLKRGDGRGPRPWINAAFHGPIPSFKEGCELCYDVMVGQIEAGLSLRESLGHGHMTLHLSSIKTQWLAFWRTIRAEGDYQQSLAEWDKKYNATPT